ncbi:MAG TPA: prepilin-type N-terminal cleavage/methylation domain-containing protein [Verrucomicrobiae bacterium]|jgi:hypothetical protein
MSEHTKRYATAARGFTLIELLVVIAIIDGVLSDGGDSRQFGWGRLKPNLRSVQAAGTMRIAPALRGSVCSLRIYGRPLSTSEAAGNFHAGCVRPQSSKLQFISNQ